MLPTELPAQWRAKADDYMRIAKAYQCRANQAIKTGYIKQALQLRSCAEELERAQNEAGARAGASQRAIAGLPALVLDGPLEGSEGLTATEGTVMPDVPAGWTAD